MTQFSPPLLSIAAEFFPYYIFCPKNFSVLTPPPPHIGCFGVWFLSRANQLRDLLSSGPQRIRWKDANVVSGSTNVCLLLVLHKRRNPQSCTVMLPVVVCFSIFDARRNAMH